MIGAEKANDVAKGVANNFLITSSSIVMPIINQVYIVSQEGIHDGGPINRGNNLPWAVPYKLNETGWNWIPQPYTGLGRYTTSYEDGKILMNATVGVIATFIPVKAAYLGLGKYSNKVTDMMAGLVTKTPAKKAISGLLDANTPQLTTSSTPFTDNASNTSSTESSSTFSYTIKEGDTLTKIAERNNTTVESISSSNNIQDVNKIYAGQTINIQQNP